MNIVQACGVIAKARPANSVIVATMLSMFIFDRIEGDDGRASKVPMVSGKLGLVMGLGVAKIKTLLSSAHAQAAQSAAPHRINSVPLMGGAAGVALGLSIAQPNRKVIVMDGDSSLLMELGGLATVATHAPINLLHCVVHNGTQFTGLDNMDVMTRDFQFAEVAKKAGYVHAERIQDGATWEKRFPELLAMTGPVFVELMVEPVPQQTKDGFVQEDFPDRQFDRMGEEALAMQLWFAQEAA